MEENPYLAPQEQGQLRYLHAPDWWTLLVFWMLLPPLWPVMLIIWLSKRDEPGFEMVSEWHEAEMDWTARGLTSCALATALTTAWIMAVTVAAYWALKFF